eukprot:1131750-Amphidinium_carterae.1
MFRRQPTNSVDIETDFVKLRLFHDFWTGCVGLFEYQRTFFVMSDQSHAQDVLCHGVPEGAAEDCEASIGWLLHGWGAGAGVGAQRRVSEAIVGFKSGMYKSTC